MKKPLIDIPTTVKDSELVKKRRAQIVHAAIKLFVQKGFHKTTIRDVAQKSGISLGAIYDYIRTKEDILVLNQDLFLEAAGVRLKQAIQNVNDPLEKLHRLIRTELHMMDQYADYLILVTRERYSLSEKYVNSVLQLERMRINIFDEVLQECIKAGQIESCNVELTTILIKVLIDAWVMKKWHIRGHVDLFEMETAILNLLLNGLAKKGLEGLQQKTVVSPIEGKKILVVNGGTALSAAIVPFLISKGAHIAVYGAPPKEGCGFPLISSAQSKQIRFYFDKDRGGLDRNFFNRIVSEMKRIDICIHDLGIGNTEVVSESDAIIDAGKKLDANLIRAQEIAIYLRGDLFQNAPRRLIYLAPWFWDRYANPVRYDVVKGATVALTKMMSMELARFSCNVHCIIPGCIKCIRPTRIEETLSDELIRKNPLGVLGDVADVANAVLFLASDASKYLTGQVLNVSGGQE